MERIDTRYAEIQESFHQMLDKDMGEGTAADYFRTVYPEPDPPEQETEYAMEAYERQKRGVELMRGYCREVFRNRDRYDLPLDNLWGAYNAVTELVDRWIPQSIRSRTRAGHLNRIWFGPGYQNKVRAYAEAMKFCRN